MKGCFSFTPRKLSERQLKRRVRTIARRPEDPTILASQTAFSVSEVEALFELYKSISRLVVDDGLINKEKFQLALFENRKKDNIFASRIFDLFDVKHKGFIDFGDFVRSLNVFHPKASKENKISFLFKLYDIHGTGFIERQEVREMLIELLHETDLKLDDEIIEKILDNTYSEVDEDRDGKINQTEWNSFVNRNPSLLNVMTLPFLMEITTSFPSFVFNSEVDDITVRQSMDKKVEVDFHQNLTTGGMINSNNI